jgi:hypothetical protein
MWCGAEHTAESGRKDTSNAASFYVLGAADDVYDLENKNGQNVCVLQFY